MPTQNAGFEYTLTWPAILGHDSQQISVWADNFNYIYHQPFHHQKASPSRGDTNEQHVMTSKLKDGQSP